MDIERCRPKNIIMGRSFIIHWKEINMLVCQIQIEILLDRQILGIIRLTPATSIVYSMIKKKDHGGVNGDFVWNVQETIDK